MQVVKFLPALFIIWPYSDKGFLSVFIATNYMQKFQKSKCLKPKPDSKSVFDSKIKPSNDAKFLFRVLKIELMN